MRTPRAIALLMIAGVVATACGARLPENVRQKAADSVLNGSGGSGSTSTSTSGDTVGSGGSSATSPTGTGVTSTKGSKSTGSSSSVTPTTASTSGTSTGGSKPGTTSSTSTSNDGGSSGAKCPTSGTDVGLTSSTINLGTIADVTGPVPGLFTGAEQGIEAFAAYVNYTGGICGHSVHVDFADGQTNCQANESDASNLIKKDFALVGTFSLYDGCGETVLKSNPTVPDIHVALDPVAETLPNHFDLEPGALGYATGMWSFYANKLGSKIKSAGTIAENLPSAIAKQNAELKAAKSVGWKFLSDIPESPTTGDFEPDFQKMCGQQHIKVFFTVTEDAQNAATMISDENKVPACKGITNIIPIAYDQSFLTFCKQLDCGSTEDSVEGWNEYSLFFNTGEAAQIPELKLFQTWFSRTNPGQPANLYALFAWADGRLFQQAFEKAGTTINRKTLIAALDKVRNYGDYGTMAPTDPSSKTTGNTCYITWKYSGSGFVRQSPASGYTCNGTFLKY